ncbi:putative WRKY transcription factor 28 [Hibiscus syriacus]|uniref:WRKY transcription factor 28 n=1 Tax=Hibiscus syriacus TaxID=106335 RepID=A0A6A2Z0I9_HIBSY|nr:putative WRKY transcription factor 28 [Hibiscus syriacus]
MEDMLGNSSFSDYISSSFPSQRVFDFSCEEETMPLGFMELLGVQDLHPSLFDMTQQTPLLTRPLHNPCSTKIESPPPELQTLPRFHRHQLRLSMMSLLKWTTRKKTRKRPRNGELKPKKTNKKRQREPRFAFMTKSEVDHLEDEYRWRKYGQKAVKNSSFPRSYYRCTTNSCKVKKRVERSFSDPSIVITTYEGQHTHPSPTMPRSSLGAVASTFDMAMQRTPSHYHQPFAANALSPLNFGQNGSSLNPSFLHERRFCSSGPSLLKDHGLLQDLVSSLMLKEE